MSIPQASETSPAAVSRRTFLASCSILAVGYAACRTLGPATRSAYTLLHDPHPDDYRPVLRGLIETVLPLEHPRFPALPLSELEARLWALFPFEDDERYLVLQKALVLFDDVRLYAHPAGPIVDAEWTALDVAERPSQPLAVMEREKRAADRARAEAFGRSWPDARQAHTLPLAARRRYLQMWNESAFVVRRQFHRSARALVLISAYSHPALWDAIGYEAAPGAGA